MLSMFLAMAVAANTVEVTGADSLRFAGDTYSLYRIDAPQAGDNARCRLEAARR